MGRALVSGAWARPAADGGIVKPGRPRICDCGKCYRCRKRAAHTAYYRKNAALIAAKTAEAKRRRKAGWKPPAKNEPSDTDLDRQAAEWLGRIDGQ
jgi:hypothetical protein